MAGVWRGMFAALPLLAASSLAGAADRAVIVLDASGSMWGQIGGRPKLEIARDALSGVLPSLPAELELGLIAYGHREKGSCEDIELVVPPASGSAGAIVSAAGRLSFQGKTPLSAAVREAAESLRYTEQKATVVLITDGVETCNADPCAVGAELEKAGADFTAHVVGFGLSAEEGREVACLAENTGGRYIQASDEAALKDALAAAAVDAGPGPVLEPIPAPGTTTNEPAPAPVPEPLPSRATAPEEPAPAVPDPATASKEPAPDPAGSAAASQEPAPAAPEFNFAPTLVLGEGGAALGDAGQSWVIHEAGPDGGRGDYVTTQYNRYEGSLEAGDYVVTARLGQAEVEQRVTVGKDGPAAPVFVLDAGTLVIHPRPSEGAEVADAASVMVEFPGADHAATFHGGTKVVLPAGEQKVTVRIGSGEVSESISLAAGETVEKDIVVGVGRVVVGARYAPGGDEVEAQGVSFDVVKAARQVDGSRQHVASAYGPDGAFDLPTGDYVLITRLEEASVETPFNIRAGETRGVEAVLGAGVLAVSAPGFSEIAVFSAGKDVQGNRKSFGLAYSDTHQVTLPAGDYAVVATRNGSGGSREMQATVRAGERTDLTLQ